MGAGGSSTRTSPDEDVLAQFIGACGCGQDKAELRQLHPAQHLSPSGRPNAVPLQQHKLAAGFGAHTRAEASAAGAGPTAGGVGKAASQSSHDFFDESQDLADYGLSLGPSNPFAKTKVAEGPDRRSGQSKIIVSANRQERPKAFGGGAAAAKHAPKAGPKTISGMAGPKAHPVISPALSREVVAQEEQAWKTKHSGRTNVSHVHSYEKLRSDQGLEEHERDLIKVLKSRSCSISHQNKHREEVRGNFWAPHKGEAVVYDVMSNVAPGGIKVMDQRPVLPSLDATEFLVAKDKKRTTVVAGTVEEEQHAHDPLYSKSRPTPDSLFGNQEGSIPKDKGNGSKKLPTKRG